MICPTYARFPRLPPSVYRPPLSPLSLLASPKEGHELTGDDIGDTISVGSTEVTLLNVTGNEIELSEPYVGGDVLEG